MSKDPLEELFGPISEETTPIPARQRLQQEQAERVRAKQTATKPLDQAVGVGALAAEKPERPQSNAKPWVIIGIIAIVAIVASIVIVSLVRGQDADEAANDGPSQTTQTDDSATDDTGGSTDDEAEDEPEDEDEDEDSGFDVPKVTVGPTNTLKIGPWNATSQLSEKFGMTSFSIPDNVHMKLDSPLIAQLPSSCQGDWGVTKTDDGYEVLKPDSCSEAPEVYDEIWGLLDAYVKTIKPA